MAGILLLGVRIWASGICFVFAGFVLGTITQEFWRGAVVRRKSTGTDLMTAMIGLVATVMVVVPTLGPLIGGLLDVRAQRGDGTAATSSTSASSSCSLASRVRGSNKANRCC